MSKKIIVPRALAKKADIRFYYSGKPCKYGHLAERYTVTGQCVVCVAQRSHEHLAQQNAWGKARYHRLKATPQHWARLTHSRLRGQAKRKNLPFDLTVEILLAAIPTNLRCPVLGYDLVFGGRKLSPDLASVDRKAPSLGYVKGNIAIISWRANRLKCDCVDPRELQRVVNYMKRSCR